MEKPRTSEPIQAREPVQALDAAPVSSQSGPRSEPALPAPVDPVRIPQPTSAALLRDLGLLPEVWLELPAPTHREALKAGEAAAGGFVRDLRIGRCEPASPLVKLVADTGGEPVERAPAASEDPDTSSDAAVAPKPAGVSKPAGAPKAQASTIEEPRPAQPIAVLVSADRPGRMLRILRAWIWGLALVAWALVLTGVRF